MSYSFLKCALTANPLCMAGRLPRDTHMSMFPVMDATPC